MYVELYESMCHDGMHFQCLWLYGMVVCTSSVYGYMVWWYALPVFFIFGCPPRFQAIAGLGSFHAGDVLSGALT